MSSIIVAAPAIWGETAPLLEIAGHLQRDGHDVVVIAGSRFADAARRTGARFVPLEGASDFDSSALSAEFPARWLRQPGPDQLDHDMEHVFLNAMPSQHRVLQRVLADYPDSVLVANATFTGAWPEAMGARGLRPSKYIAVACNPVTLGTAQATPLGPVPGLDGNTDPVATAAANAALGTAMQRSAERLRELARGYDCDLERLPTTVLDGFVTIPEQYVALTVREMDFNRTDLPDSVVFAGPILVTSGEGSVSSEVSALLNSGRSVVLVTQGTSANEDLEQLVAPALAGLAEDEDVRVIAATGRSSGLDAPENAVVVDWVPFAPLLPNVSVFVTNGGWGGTQAALAAGVPVVVSGATEDKALVAARVRAAGVGVDLGAERPDPEAVRAAVLGLLNDTDVRARVARIADAYRGTNALRTVSELVR